MAIAIRLNDIALQTSVNHTLGWGALLDGDYRQGAEILSQVAEAFQGDPHDQLWQTGAVLIGSVGSRAFLAWCLAELGEFAEAMARSEEAVRIAREVNHSTSLVYAYRILGVVHLRQGAIPRPFRRSSAPWNYAGGHI